MIKVMDFVRHQNQGGTNDGEATFSFYSTQSAFKEIAIYTV